MASRRSRLWAHLTIAARLTTEADRKRNDVTKQTDDEKTGNDEGRHDADVADGSQRTKHSTGADQAAINREDDPPA